MPDNPPLTIRKSPFLFLKTLVVIEFFFALLPFLVTLLLPVEASYEAAGLGRSLPYGLALTIVMTTLQVLIIGLSFAAWYFPLYEVDGETVAYRRGSMFEEQILAETPEIRRVEVHQGPLAQRLDYGDLVIETRDGRKARLQDIPNPGQYAVRLEHLAAASRPLDGLAPAPGGGPDGAADWQNPDAAALLAAGEGQFVEFKASLRWDLKQNRVNKNLYEPVMKTIAAFLNAGGGVLFIGVDDEGRALGLEPDLQTVPKRNLDGFENTFNSVFNQMIGAEHRPAVGVTFPEVDGQAVCRVTVQPGPRPAFVNHQGEESFYIRAGNATIALPVSKAVVYIQDRFAG